MDQKKTLVVGGSVNPARFSNKAIHKLVSHGHQVESVGIKADEVAGVTIEAGRPEYKDIDTVTLYVGPRNQPSFYEYLIGLKPKRIIFNPGTANEEFELMATNSGIEVVHHCTLIMLDEGTF